MKKYFCDRCNSEIKAGYLFIVQGGIYKGESEQYEICGDCYNKYHEFMTHETEGCVVKEIKAAINTMQWVQEYIYAVGESHKEAYINGLQNRMDSLISWIKEKSA